MRIEPLDRTHLEDASKLFAALYRREREAVPILDENFGTAERVLPKLESLLEKFPGIAAFENEKLVGYMAGFAIDEFLGPHKGAYCPEWAHASTGDNSFEIYRLMYRAMGQRWAEDGCITHAINFMARASEAREAFCWNGFGDICFDAMRPVEPLDVELPDGLGIFQIREKDISVWLSMVEASARHLSRSPAFIPHLKPEDPEDLRNFLKEPGNHVWVAWLDDEVVGFTQVTPVGHGAAWVVNGEKKFAINGAYVYPEHRGKGIAKMLLSVIMDWGVEEGFVRCSVDFEATNPEACNFWLKHFQPVCRSMVRRLDDRILKNI